MPRKKAEAPKESDMMRTLGVDSLSRIDPDEDFSDVDGDPNNDFSLVNEESDRQYVWVHNTPDAVGQYKGGTVPYQVEYATKDGVTPKMAIEIKDGEAITKRSHVLMSCDKALWQKKNRQQLARTRKINDQMFKRNQRDWVHSELLESR